MSVDKELIEKVKQFLHNNNVASLATISPADLGPEAAVVFYYYNGLETLYIATGSDSRKIQNIQANSKISLTVYNDVKKEEVQIKGNAFTVPPGNEASDLLLKVYDALKKHVSPSSSWPLIELHPENITVVKIDIGQFKYSQFKEKAEIVVGTALDLQ